MVKQTSNYNLRDRNNYIQPITRGSQYQNSFIPQVSKSWNVLPENVRNIGCLSAFKNFFTQHDPKTPRFFYDGIRKGQIIHSRMRMLCSPLNEHLFNMKIIDIKYCACGANTESPQHYFFECPIYNDLRVLFEDLDESTPQDIRTFLYGSRDASQRANSKLFAVISKFIVKSGRFWKGILNPMSILEVLLLLKHKTNK